MLNRLIAATGGFVAFAGVALAEEATAGRPTDGHVGMQPAATALAEDVHGFHNELLMPIMTAICVLVLALLIWVVIRYNAKANPTPRRFSHNTLVEIIWTGVPIIILLVIALPSFQLLHMEDVQPDGKQAIYIADGRTNAFTVANTFEKSRKATKAHHVSVAIEQPGGGREYLQRSAYEVSGLGEDEITVTLASAPARGARVAVIAGRTVDGGGCGFWPGLMEACRGDVVPAPALTVRATGRQWGWNYAYPEFGDFEFTADLAPKETLEDPSLYLLEANNRVVVPVGEPVRIATTAIDVIHSWAIPAFSVKIDAVPGRYNETWFRVDREGVYYGQCSEICGINHAYMPIAVEVVSREAFCDWIAAQQADFGIERTAEQKAAEPVCGVLAGGGAQVADAGSATAGGR